MQLSDLFRFNKNDRFVAFWLLAIVACIIGFVAFGEKKDNDEELDSATEQGKAPRSALYNNEEYNHHYYKDKGGSGYRSNGCSADFSPPRGGAGGGLHPFDLNIASPDEMQELGFTETQIRSVLKYRSMGGIYRYKEQLSKIAGMTKGDYDRLAPYFYVSDDFRPASDFVHVPQNKHRSYNHRNGSYHNYGGGNHGNNGYTPTGSQQTSANASGNTSNGSVSADNGNKPNSTTDSRPRYESNKLKHGEKVPINASDTTALKRIPGVGSYYAAQIVKYREKLGGFVSVQQLDDLQNIPADIQDYLSLDPVPVRKIKVNSLPINKMITHPYISYYQAQAIKDYIRKNGRLKSLYELRLNKNFPEEDISRLEPYVDYE